MKFSCDSCNAQYMIADEKVGDRGVKVKCKKCANVIIVKPLAAATADPSKEEAPSEASPPEAGKQQGGGLDSLFGGGANSWDDFGEGAESAAAPTAQAPAFSTPAGEKEWYVAIDESQVGPIDVREIEERWDAQELSEDSLAWKAGMNDWLPVAEIAELAYLVTERPQQRGQGSGVASDSSTGAVAGGGISTGSSLGPVAFGGGGDTGEAVSWKPSAASALSSLVQEELTAQESEAASAAASEKPPAGVPDLGVPGFAAGDLFGAGGGAGPAGANLGAPQAPMPDVGNAWSVPDSRKRADRDGGLKAIHVVLGGVIVAVLVIGAVAGLVLWQGRPALAPPEAPQQAAQQTAKAPPPPAPHATAATEAAPGEPEAEKASEEPATQKTTRRTTRPPKASKPKPKPRVAAAEPPAKASLTKDDIVSTVKQNAAKVAPCLKTARSRNEIVPGSYKFVIDWTIRPNGSVTNARLTGPSNVLGTSLKGCFEGVIRAWRFPASQNGAPITNFPFGPITVR